MCLLIYKVVYMLASITLCGVRKNDNIFVELRGVFRTINFVKKKLIKVVRTIF